MKKNSQYIGVDEKYIPEDEKYVDNYANNEIKGVINDGIKSAKNYISDKDNQEKIKQTGKKGLKILKGVGIGYLAIVGFIILMVIVVFVIVFSNFFKINNQADHVIDKSSNIIDNIIDSGSSSYEKSTFNNSLELYKGTQYGGSVSRLLDEVITLIKKNSNHSIQVIFDKKTMSSSEEIISIKSELDNASKYEVVFDYDLDGFINKVTITKY